MKISREDSIASTIWITILIWLCDLPFPIKATMTDKELRNFTSPLRLKRERLRQTVDVDCDKINSIDDKRRCLQQKEIKEMLEELEKRKILSPEEEGCDVEKEEIVSNLDDYMDQNSNLPKILEDLKSVLTQGMFCKSNPYIKCYPKLSEGICQCVEEMVDLEGVCVLPEGHACGRSWERPSSVSVRENVEPRCGSQRCKLRNNGIWTCNPDPMTRIFVTYNAPVSSINSSSNLQFNVICTTILNAMVVLLSTSSAYFY